jgi:hypothetical protein
VANAVGKPKPELFRLALARADVPAERALFVGDRAETDVVGARAAGLACALALSGVTVEAALGSLPVLPDHIIETLADIVRDVPAPRIDREPDALVAVDGGELARIGVSRVGTTTLLRDLHVQGRFTPDATWRVVRRLLVEAVSGAERVEAAPELRAYLERIGVDGDPQASLFSG